MSSTGNTRDFLLSLAREVIGICAAKDGCDVQEYDAIRDPEGCITSLLTALLHWCNAYGFSWEQELRLAQGFFEQDLAESQPGAKPLPSPTAQELCCPACGHRESFVIEASECLLVFADGTVLEDDTGMEWGDHSCCRCHECNHTGSVYQFRLDTQTTRKEAAHG